MKKFLIRILIICIPIILFVLIGELALRNIPNDYSLKRKFLNKNAQNLKTLVLGSSHFYYGVNPRRLTQPAFNAAMVSQSLDYDLKIIEKYQSEFKNLETLILPISYFSLFSTLESGMENWRIPNYNIYYNIGSPLEFEFLNGKGNHFINKIGYYYFINSNLNLADSLGWGVRNKKVNSRKLQLSGLTAAKRHTKENFNLLPSQLKNLRRIIEIANKNKWDVVLVTPPAYHSYVANLNANQLDLTIKHCEEIAKDFDNVYYYNLLQDNSLNSSDFFDADHLNMEGANKFSQLLNRKISTEIP